MCPDVVSFSTAAAAVAATDEWPMALQLFEEMVQQEVRGSLVWGAGYMKLCLILNLSESPPQHKDIVDYTSSLNSKVQLEIALNVETYRIV